MMSAAVAESPPGPTRTLSCLVVEDHTIFLQLLVGMLRTVPGIEVRATTRTVAEAVAALSAQAFDLLVLDLRLPDGDGLDVLHVAADANPAIHCIVLSSAADEFACPQSLRGNLSGLIDKTQAYEQLQATIVDVMRSRGVDATTAPGVGRDVLEILRPREADVFRLIGQGLKTVDIGRQLGIAKSTVETYRKGIAAKLRVSGAELVRLATIHNQTSLRG